jgi:hypothetical protein
MYIIDILLFWFKKNFTAGVNFKLIDLTKYLELGRGEGAENYWQTQIFIFMRQMFSSICSFLFFGLFLLFLLLNLFLQLFFFSVCFCFLYFYASVSQFPICLIPWLFNSSFLTILIQSLYFVCCFYSLVSLFSFCPFFSET